MTFQLDHIKHHVEGGSVARVLIVGAQGSVPRGSGTSMLVTESACLGTIGGGALEFEAIRVAREALADGRDRLDRRPLGPSLGQCCGGAVTVLTEVWSAERLVHQIAGDVVARPLPGTDTAMPLAIRHSIAARRSGRGDQSPVMVDGWILEAISQPERTIWVWGAGHVGRAVVSVLAPFSDISIYWCDTGLDRFPSSLPDAVDALVAENPAELVTLCNPDAEHLVLTYSHALDLELCHRLLGRPFRSLGLIGSATKRSRFRKRLGELGHSIEQVDRITCPIGDPSLGKHPQAIALGVATALLRVRDRGTGMIGKSA